MSVEGRVQTIDEWNAWWEKNYKKAREPKRDDDSNQEGALSEDDFNRLCPMLVKHKDVLFNGRSNCKIFVPLCGKSPNVKWLAEQGHSVVAIECSEYAILDFFETSGMEFSKTVSTVDPAFYVYSAKDADITIYQGDYFNFNSQIASGHMDGVTDTASLNTIDYNAREKYVEVMLSLLKPDARYLLSGWFFGDVRTWPNNPYDITQEDVKTLFDSKCDWILIDEDFTEWGIDRTYLIQLKK